MTLLLSLSFGVFAGGLSGPVPVAGAGDDHLCKRRLRRHALLDSSGVFIAGGIVVTVW